MAWTESRKMSNLSIDWYIIIPCLAVQEEGAKNRLMQQMEKFYQQEGMRNFRMLIKISMMGHRFKLGRGRSPGEG